MDDLKVACLTAGFRELEPALEWCDAVKQGSFDREKAEHAYKVLPGNASWPKKDMASNINVLR
jgi:hypothetical protein